ncbi:hypothetical protein B0H11DRAFT_2205124 [Mycena galericulata]|nr:hypothetical protein B0H11DRAFT_2205124 [Mycena galericulata]
MIRVGPRDRGYWLGGGWEPVHLGPPTSVETDWDYDWEPSTSEDEAGNLEISMDVDFLWTPALFRLKNDIDTWRGFDEFQDCDGASRESGPVDESSQLFDLKDFIHCVYSDTAHRRHVDRTKVINVRYARNDFCSILQQNNGDDTVLAKHLYRAKIQTVKGDSQMCSRFGSLTKLELGRPATSSSSVGEMLFFHKPKELFQTKVQAGEVNFS